VLEVAVGMLVSVADEKEDDDAVAEEEGEEEGEEEEVAEREGDASARILLPATSLLRIVLAAVKPAPDCRVAVRLVVAVAVHEKPLIPSPLPSPPSSPLPSPPLPRGCRSRTGPQKTTRAIKHKATLNMFGACMRRTFHSAARRWVQKFSFDRLGTWW
jgi:hypothetical protein